MNDRSSVAIGLSAIVVLVVLALMGLLFDVARAAIGLTVLLLPGYAFSRAVFAPGTLDGSRRAAVILTSGLVVVVLVGLVANQLPTGLAGPVWLVLIAGATLGLRELGVARGHIRRDGPQRWLASFMSRNDPGSTNGVPPSARRTRLAPVLMTTVAVMVALGAFSVARTGQDEQDRRTAFTEFWAVLAEDRTGDVRIGATSHETAATDYTVRVISGGTAIAFEGSFSLDPGASWETTITLPVTARATPGPGSSANPGASPDLVLVSTMRASLYVAGRVAPYREVWLNGSTPS